MSLASRIAEIHNYIAEMKEKYDVAGGSSRDSENNGRKANDGRTGYPNPYSSSTSSAYLPDLYGDRFSETTKTEKARIKLPPPVVVAAVQTAEQQKAAASGQVISNWQRVLDWPRVPDFIFITPNSNI